MPVKPVTEDLSHLTGVVPVLTVGERILIARRHAGYARAEDLASELGLTRTTLARYEAGIAEPPTRCLLAIAKLCSVDPLWLMRGLTESLGAASLPTSRDAFPGQLSIAWPIAA